MRNLSRRLSKPLAVVLFFLGLLNAALGSVVSGLIIAACAALLFLRLTYWPNYPRRGP